LTAEVTGALKAVGGFDHLEAFSAQEFCDQAPEEVLVLHQ
jgi:hypothetical protein